MRFRNAGNSFKITFKTIDGQHFRGALSNPTVSNNRTTDFTPTRRILTIDNATKLKPGIVFSTPTGETYMTYYNGEFEYVRSDKNSFGAVRVNSELNWKRNVKVVDSVTGLPKGESLADLGQIWAAVEADGKTIDTLGVAKNDFRVITNSPIKQGDLIGDYRALRVDVVLGVYYVAV